VFRLAHLGGSVAGEAAGFDQFNSVDQFATPVTLVALRIVVVAEGAFASDESVSQESITL